MLTAAPLQTSYQQYGTAAQIGMPRDGQRYNIETGILEDPTGDGVGFGLAVSRGSLHGSKSVALGQLSGGAFVGITFLDASHFNRGGALADKFSDGDNIPVLDFGTIWVSPATTNVVAGHPVYFNSATGRLGDSSIANAVLIAGAVWMDDKPNTDQPMINFNGLAGVKLGIMS